MFLQALLHDFGVYRTTRAFGHSATQPLYDTLHVSDSPQPTSIFVIKIVILETMLLLQLVLPLISRLETNFLLGFVDGKQGIVWSRSGVVLDSREPNLDEFVV